MVEAQVLGMDRYPVIRLTVFFLALGLCAGMANASELEIYPGAELVVSSEDKNMANRRVILGSLKKINNILIPKSYIYVNGGLSSETYYIPGERRVDRVAEFYELQMKAQTEVLFSCQGRDCGSSNFWADSIFKAPILYGPEQYQSYFIGLSADKQRYLAIYVAQRGTRKIYVYEQIVRLSESSTDKESLLTKLLATGRIVIPMNKMEQDVDDIADDLAGLLAEEPELDVILVAHDSMRRGESLENSRQRTRRFANAVMSALVESGIEAERLAAYGLGPLAPLASGDSPRLEVLVIPEP